MNIELILIILLGVFVLILIGVALHLAKTIEQLHQYIGELERDMRNSVDVLRATGSYKNGNNDTATNHQ